MTDAEWAEVRAAMPVPAWLLKLGGRPEAFCHREMLDAVRYLVDNGVKWTALPVDFPYWRAVYDSWTAAAVRPAAGTRAGGGPRCGRFSW
jgi:transposase